MILVLSLWTFLRALLGRSTAVTLEKHRSAPSIDSPAALRSYLAYYNATRPHQSLDNDSPRRREVQSVASGRIVTIPEVGGRHHRYHRAA